MLGTPFRASRGLLFLLSTIIARGLFAQAVKADTITFHFAFDRSEIRPADKLALRSFVRERILVGGPGAAVRMAATDAATGDIDSLLIAGYTDTVGSLAYNDRLSLRRAIAADILLRQYLTLSPSLPVRIEGRGEAEAFTGDDSASRRVILVFWHHPVPPPVAVRTDTVRIAPEPDTVIQLEDIRFYANTANLTEEARLSLPRYITDLFPLRDRYLEVDGYCNSPGPPLRVTDPLYILSVQRAKLIYDYLIERGFDPGKLTYKGKGNTNPRQAHPTTRDESEQNMRVEIRVFKKRPEP